MELFRAAGTEFRRSPRGRRVLAGAAKLICCPAVTRDPALLEECLALRAILERHPTVAALRANPDWPTIGIRLERLLGTPRRYTAASPPPPSRNPARVRAVHWNIEHGNWYERVETALRDVIAEGRQTTYDLGGETGTSEFADAIIARLADQPVVPA